MKTQLAPHVWSRPEIQAAHVKLRRLLSGVLDVSMPPTDLACVRSQLTTLCLVLGCQDPDCALLAGERRQWEVLPFADVLALVDRVVAMDREILAASRVCRQCGCTEEHACVDAVLGPCWWVEEDLCSHCLPVGEAQRRAVAGTLWDGDFREEGE